jgi:hypothetical protein
MRKRNPVVLTLSVAALALLFFAGEKPVLRAAVPAPAVKGSASAEQWTTKEVVFGKLQPYTKKSALFTMSVPDNWTVKDTSSGDETILVVSDPTENGIIVVRSHTIKEASTDLGGLLKTFVHDAMGSLNNFAMGDPIAHSDGSFTLVFHYNQVVDEKDVRMYGEGFIVQKNGIQGIMVLFLPQEQFSAKSKSAYEITDSFHVAGRK